VVLGEACRAPCRSRPRAIERRVTLSRDRRIITRKRNKLTIVAVAGALSVATAATAAAAVWPSGAPVGKAGTAFATLSQPGHRPADGPASPPAAHRAVAHSQAAAGHQAVLAAQAQQQAAMHRAVVTQPASHQAANRQGAKPQPAATATTGPSQAAARQSQQAVQPASQPTTQQAAVASPTPTHSATPTASHTPAPSATPTATPSPAPSGSPQSIAQSMLKSFGWSSSQFSCLKPLWQHESSWSVSASNSSTGAYGIPQAAPGSKMASAGPDWKTNASTQIKWGLGYIKDTYGSPCAAWSHEQADGWY
jgi:hypothetical protein